MLAAQLGGQKAVDVDVGRGRLAEEVNVDEQQRRAHFLAARALVAQDIFERRQMICDHPSGDIEPRNLIGADLLRDTIRIECAAARGRKQQSIDPIALRLIFPHAVIAVIGVVIETGERRAEDILRIEREIDRHRGGEQPEGGDQQGQDECMRA